MKRYLFLLFFSLSALFISGQERFWQFGKDSLKLAIQTAKEDTTKVDLLISLGSKYPWSYPDTAVQYGHEALALAEKLKYTRGIFNARNVIISALHTLGNYPLALEYDLKNQELLQTFDDAEMKIESLTSLAGSYRNTGEINKWLEYTHQALALARKSKLKFREGLIRNAVADVYLDRNQPDSALFYAKGSYELINYWPAQPVRIGHAYLQKNMFDSAVYWFKIGLHLADSNQTEQDFVDVDNFMAIIHKQKNNIDSSIWYSKKALAEKLSASYPLGTLKASDLLVSLYESQKKPDSALKYFKMSAALKDSLFGREKAIAEQNVLYNKKDKEKEVEASRLKYRNQARLYLLSVGILALLIIAFVLFRANRQKQKSYVRLQQQKDEIDFHKRIAETSLNELKTTQAHLIQSEKMASLGELTSGIAHEIQNPLNFVNNFSDLNSELIDEAKQEMEKGNIPETKAILDHLKGNQDKINHHGKRAEEIVKGMLQHSRISTGQKESADINKLVADYLRLAMHGMKAKDKAISVKVETDFDTNLEKIDIVPHEIGRVFLNLINNAFYAASQPSLLHSARIDGGISGSDSNKTPTVWLSTKKEKKEILIKVRDNGPGIPSNILDKIFQPFFTTKPAGQGTGLGLSLAYDIVKAHGGEIKVETIEGEGSQFIVQLPV